MKSEKDTRYLPPKKKIYLLCHRSISYLGIEVYLTLPSKYIFYLESKYLLVSGEAPLVRHAGRNGLFVCHAAAIMGVLFAMRSRDDSSVRHADVKVHGKPLLRGGGVFLAVNIPAGA